MEIEAIDMGRALPLSGLHLGRERGELQDELAGPVACCDARSGRGSDDGGEQRLVGGKGVDVGIVGQQALVFGEVLIEAAQSLGEGAVETGTGTETRDDRRVRGPGDGAPPERAV